MQLAQRLRKMGSFGAYLCLARPCRIVGHTYKLAQCNMLRCARASIGARQRRGMLHCAPALVDCLRALPPSAQRRLPCESPCQRLELIALCWASTLSAYLRTYAAAQHSASKSV